MSARVAYRIETERLVLRGWELSDTQELYALVVRNRAYLAPWMPWARDEPSLEGYLDFVRQCQAAMGRGEDFTYGVFDREEGALLGGAGLHTRCGPGGLEIGYWLDERHAGRGLATEAAAALTRSAFDLHRMQRVELRALEENHASRRIAERLGFTYEGLLRRRVQHGERWVDLRSYTVVPEDVPGGPLQAHPYRAFDGLGRPLTEG